MKCLFSRQLLPEHNLTDGDVMDNHPSKLYLPKSILAAGAYNEMYLQVTPPDVLAPFIVKYWASPGDSNSSKSVPKNELIVPDGCIDLVFIISQETCEYAGTVYGPTDKPFQVSMGYGRHTIFGITFCPGGFYPLLRSPLGSIQKHFHALSDLRMSFHTPIAEAGSIGRL